MRTELGRLELQQKQPKSRRMNIHSNARLMPCRRVELVLSIIKGGHTPKEAAASFGACERTARKWLARYRVEGVSGLRDRSSRPLVSPRQTPSAQVATVLSLRKLRMPGFQIARQTGLSKATISRILRRHKLHRLSLLDPPPPVRRYERLYPGELIHTDIKKLGRIERPGFRATGDRRDRTIGAGWEFVHVAIDDASRIAFAKIMPDETAQSAIAFLQAALNYFASLGIKAQRLMSDNGSCYISLSFAAYLRSLGIRHIRTRPYTPKTNGKAERFIQTSLREWAYVRSYQHSSLRQAQLPQFLHFYNWHRPHSSLNHLPPASRLPLSQDNLLTLHR
jgi:transposase InsO family protein